MAKRPVKPGKTAKVSLRNVTRKNLVPIMNLSVSESQKKFVANNAKSIAQGCFNSKAWFRAIYADDTPVGFAMLHEDRRKGNYYLWRFMIDENFQGKGYGAKALALIIERVRKSPKAKEMTLSFVRAKGGPEKFYQKFGFVDTGKIEWGEHVARLKFE